MTRLSHSAITKYQTCPKAYYYHYRELLRDTKTSAALLFGSAIDKALGSLLQDKSLDAEKIFEQEWEYSFINKTRVHIASNDNIVYSNTDFDKELLQEIDYDQLITISKKPKEDILPYYNSIVDKKKDRGIDSCSDLERATYKLANWLCLHRKGLLMVDAFRKKILPNIQEVYAVQREIKIDGDDGDSITGFIDFVAKWNDGRTVVFDIKTSSIHYDADSVLTSPQLAIYVAAVEQEFKTRTAGYIVFKKNILKNRTKLCSECNVEADKGSRVKTCAEEYSGARCGGVFIETLIPECDVQIIINDIPQRLESIVLDNYSDINTSIKSGVFPRNLQSCVMPYGKCSFYDKCHYGKETNLVKVEK